MSKLKQQIHSFILHCRHEKNLTEKTIKSYQTDLVQLTQYIKQNSPYKEASEVEKEILRNYIKSMEHLKPKSIKRKIATAKAFFNYLEFEDSIPANPFRKIKIKIKEPQQLPSVLSLPEISDILTTTYNRLSKKPSEKYSYKEQLRNLAVLELLFATGARVSEISGLKNTHIDLNTGVIKLTGKGRKERIIQICNREVLGTLQLYYQNFKKEIDEQDYFLMNRFKKRLSEQSIRYMVKQHVKEAGISKRVTPHTFRHSFATLLLEQNVDIKYIQHLLGHSSILTTQIYTHVNTEKQRIILSQNHPRESIWLSQR